MSKKNEHTKLVPELRFPEFENDKEWIPKRLDAVSKIDRGKSKHRPRNADFLYGGKYPFVQTGDIKAAELYLTEYSQTYSEEGLKQSKLWDENTLCITIAANIAETAILKIKACFPDSIIGLIPDENEAIILFVKYYFDKFKLDIKELAQGIAQDNLNKEKLSGIQFNFPSIPEQQKIANTLTSLDELIGAENEKLNTLQTHKKGLLQQLFPAKGEKVPKLRFGEFEEEWEEITLGEVCNYFKGFAFKSKDYTTEGRRIIRVSDMGYDYIKDTPNAIYIKEEDAKLYDKWKLQKNDLIITTVGSKPPVYNSLVGRSIVVKINNEYSLLNQNAVCLRSNQTIEQDFLNSLFKRKEYTSFIESIIRGNANQGSIALVDLFKYAILKPSPTEQQKIANCLSSLDDRIAAQSEKIAALKAHKKGLMQQMFPNLKTSRL